MGIATSSRNTMKLSKLRLRNTITRPTRINIINITPAILIDALLETETIYYYGSKITVSNGIIWMADHCVNHTNQTILLDKYSNVPSYKIGLVPTKSFVTLASRFLT